MRLADHDRARGAETAHHRGVTRRRRAEGVGADRRDLTADVGVVLDRHRHAEQRPLLARAHARLCLRRLRERALGEHNAERVQLRIDAGDPLEIGLDQLARRDGAGADELCLARDRSERELGAGDGGGV
jgi:hypothetical protein